MLKNSLENKIEKIVLFLVHAHHPKGVHYGQLDQRLVYSTIPEAIIGDGNKLMPLLEEMISKDILQYGNGGYIKGINFPEMTDELKDELKDELLKQYKETRRYQENT